MPDGLNTLTIYGNADCDQSARIINLCTRYGVPFEFVQVLPDSGVQQQLYEEGITKLPYVYEGIFPVGDFNDTCHYLFMLNRLRNE